MRGALTQLWYGNASGAALLAPLAALYGAVTSLRRRAYESGLLRRYGVGDLASVEAPVLDENFVCVHSSHNDTGQVDAFPVAFEGFRICSGL